MEAYLRHESGDLYAVQFDEDGRIIGVYGPLHYTECTEQNLSEFEYRAEDAEWADGELSAARMWQK